VVRVAAIGLTLRRRKREMNRLGKAANNRILTRRQALVSSLLHAAAEPAFHPRFSEGSAVCHCEVQTSEPFAESQQTPAQNAHFAYFAKKRTGGATECVGAPPVAI
jgi:hypothetical protein